MQGSKRNKRWILLSAGASHAIIVESSRYSYLYKRPNVGEQTSVHQILEHRGLEFSGVTLVELINNQNTVYTCVAFLARDAFVVWSLA